MKKIVIVIFFSFLFNAFLFGQEKNGVSELSWINKVETDAEKFHENGTRTCYLNIYGEIPELYVQSIIDQVLTHSSVLRFNLDYGKNFSRCVCEIKNDFTNEDLALAIDEIIDIYYDSKDYLIDKEKLEQEKIKKELETKRYIEKDKKIDKVEFSASTKTDIDKEIYLKDAAQKAEAMAIWERELQPSKLNAAKWQKGGIFEGYTPKDEIQSLRTQNSKKFRNPDGSITAQIGGNYSSWTCTDDDLSYVPSMRLTYSPASGPCIPSFNSSTYDYIANFTLGSINNSTGQSPNGYGDYTYLSTNLNSGSTVNASLTSYSGSGDHGVAIWIDFNDNGVFETSERVGTLDNVGPNSTVSIPITIPNDASEGSHRLRVIYQYDVAGTSIDPCASSYHGEGEDYTVAISCTPSFSYSSDYITNFTLSNINNSTGFSSGGYGDYTHLSTILVAGSSTTASLTSSSGSGTHAAAIWIDFNDNGIFETSERVGTMDNIDPSTTVSIPITIPSSAPVGSHVLRVVYRYNEQAINIHPCVSGAYGEGEDYTVLIQMQVPVSGSNSYTTCSGHLYDNGGSTGNYANYSNGYTVLYPGTSEHAVQLTGTYNTEENYDYIYIYDGNGTSGTLLGQFTGIGNIGIIVSSGANVPLTVQFTSDGSVQYSGFDFTIACVPTPCNPTTSGGSDYYNYITNFTTTGGISNINKNSGGSANGYQDFYDTDELLAEVGATINYSITCSSGTYGRAIWVDWNENGVFEASEQVASSSSYESSPLTGSFTIPAGTSSGTKRMRILAAWTPSNPSNPCTNSGNGEYEDYKLVVTCRPSTSEGSTYYISNFTTTGGETNINNNSDGSPNGYQDFYNTASMSASPGSTINYTMTVAGGSTYGRAIWVDWNENGVFEASEQVASSTSYSSSPLTGSFTIPEDAVPGPKRMRILASWTPNNPSDPCNNSGSGEYEDYKLIVTYCSPSTTGGSSHYISNFTTTGASVNINNSSGGSGSGYQDFYNTASMSASPGSTINYTMTVAGGSTYGRAIWVDWNENGVFEASEQVASSSSYESSPLTGSFTIPAGASLGTKRMRIVATYIPSNPINPCYNSYEGEYEDYKLLISCMPSTDDGSSHYISNFTTTGASVNINNSSGGSDSGYQDFYNSSFSLNAMAGTTINYTMTVAGGSNYGHAIWVDLNENGIFEYNERLANSTSFSYSPITGSFTIPAGTSLGAKRMRVVATYAPSDPINPCYNSYEGEYEDYKFIVIENPCDNITPMSCGATYNATLYPNSGAWTNYTGASYSWPGSEKVWAFTAPTTGSYTFNLAEGDEDADFFLMSACDPSSTSLSNGYWYGGSSGSSNTVTLTGGVTYYLIADLFSYSASTTVTVSVDCPPPPPTVSSNSPVCENSTLNLSTTMSGATSCNWSGPNGFTSTSSSPSISNVSLAAAGTYYVTVTASNGLTAGGSTTVTVHPTFTAGAIASTGETICYGTVPTTTIGSNSNASGGDGNITYRWQYSTVSNFSSGVTTLSINTPTYKPTQTLTQTTYYRRQAHDGLCNTSWATSSNVWAVTVVPDPTAPTLSVATPSNGNEVCVGGVVKATFTDGSGGTGCADEYQYSVNGGSTWNNYSPGNNISATTIGNNAIQIRTRRSCSGLGCDGPGTTWDVKAQWTVVPDPTAPILSVATPSNGNEVCVGGVVKATFTAGSGGAGCTDEYQYSVNGGSTWNSYSPGDNITATTTGANAIQIRTRRSCSGLGCDGPGTTWDVKAQWTVVANPSITVSGATTMCPGLNTSLTANGSGGTGTSTYQWQYYNGSSWINVGTNSSAYTTDNLINSTDFRCIYSTNGTGCTDANSNTVTVTIQTPNTADLSSNDYVWYGSGSTNWTTASNWLKYNGTNFETATNIPTINDNVLITHFGTPSTCVSNLPYVAIASGECNSIKINPNAQVFINNSKKLTIKGNLTNAGTITSNNGSIDIAGNWTNTGTFNAGTGTVTFNGNTTQVIKAGSSAFNNVVFNNTASGIYDINITQPCTINGAATFTNGVVGFMTSGTLTFGANATSNLGNANSYVNGSISKIGTSPFNFAVGEGENWGPCAIAAPATNSTITAQYKHSAGPLNWSAAYMCVGSNLHHTSGVEHWLLTSTSSTPNVTLYWNTASDVVEPNDLVVAHYNASSSCWENKGAANITGNANAGSVTNAIPFTSYSPITLGTKTEINSLPVELTLFSAECDNNNNVQLYWTTASEINNDYFEIQRSTDDLAWEVIETVQGAGFSNTSLNYDYLDRENPNANTYYRLRQVDYDGRSKFSDIISIRCENNMEKPTISIYPNPFNSILNIEFKNWDMKSAEIELVDITSRTIKTWKLENTLQNFVYEVNLSNLNPAMYMLKIKTSNGVIMRKIEKQ